MKNEENAAAQFVEQFINQTNQSVFLTGKAGTGKTTLLKKIIETTYKQTVIVAPTGIAALNAGGVTIHSFFQLPFAGFVPTFDIAPQFTDGIKIENKESLSRHFNMNKQRLQLIRSVELLIIDEVSMLRADLLDAIDWTLRNVRKVNQPYGGVQVLFIGDLLQLPPVVKPEEWQLLRQYYRGIHFFHAHVMHEQPVTYLELSKIYRQDDADFIDLLNHLRHNKIAQQHIELLNQYVQPDFDPLQHEGYITLTTHNYKADEINTKALTNLSGEAFVFEAEIINEFPPHNYPIDDQLTLKKGAQVMFIKNDISMEKQFYNGKMGTVSEINENEIFVTFPEENKTIEVDRYEWENIRYKVNEKTSEIEEEVLGTFTQFPLKLAWAITVHKSQGLTFDKAVLDVSAAFAPGQAYVAFSRLRSLSGLVLTSPVRFNQLMNDQDVIAYTNQPYDESNLTTHLEVGVKRYLLHQFTQAFEWGSLIDKWLIHEASYKNVPSKSLKGLEKSWVAHQVSQVEATREPARKFQRQLEQILLQEKVDFNYLKERVQAAYLYFFKILDNLVYSTLKKRDEVLRKPKSKAFIDELTELDELQTEAVLKLKRARLFLEAFLRGEKIDKDQIWNQEIKTYKKDKLTLIKEEKQSRSLLDLDEEVYEQEEELASFEQKKEKASKKKKDTYQETLNLVLEGKTAEEIAALRQFSVGTITTHFIRLIQQEKLTLNRVLSKERIQALENAFEDFNGNSLSALKEHVGDDFTWEELKLFQAGKKSE